MHTLWHKHTQKTDFISTFSETSSLRYADYEKKKMYNNLTPYLKHQIALLQKESHFMQSYATSKTHTIGISIQLNAIQQFHIIQSNYNLCIYCDRVGLEGNELNTK